MTENEIIYDILELARGNQIIDDVEIDGRQIMFLINNQRHLWIRNEYNKPGRKMDPFMQQDLGCVKLIEVDGAECCDTDISSDCKVLRTENKIPTTIELHSGPSITRVGPIKKIDIPFSFIPYNRAQFFGDDKYANNITQAFLLNGYIYLITPTTAASFLEYINVRGVFVTPSDAANFSDCDGTTCYDKATSTYPISSWMYAYFKPQVVQQLMLATQTPKDTAGDSQENLQKQ
tara:strand:+ start:1899 stop:2597 length:699 start_codon:yes stop_codon:yes gene_type:complete